LAPDERKAEALDQVQRFLAHSPGDLELGRSMAGKILIGNLLAAASKELERRKTEAEPLDDLMREARFYAGLRQEWNGTAAAALEAYKHSLAYPPKTFKWEWAYARQHFARLPCEARNDANPSNCTIPPFTYFLNPYNRDFHAPSHWKIPGGPSISSSTSPPRELPTTGQETRNSRHRSPLTHATPPWWIELHGTNA
jgi:hypothetical protein